MSPSGCNTEEMVAPNGHISVTIKFIITIQLSLHIVHSSASTYDSKQTPTPIITFNSLQSGQTNTRTNE